MGYAVTGGGRGIGRAVVERLLADGHRAAAIAHLLSPDAAFITGATIPVDGGRTILAREP